MYVDMFHTLVNIQSTAIFWMLQVPTIHPLEVILQSWVGLAKRDLWSLGAESWFAVASYAFAKMIPPLHVEDLFGKSIAC